MENDKAPNDASQKINIWLHKYLPLEKHIHRLCLNKLYASSKNDIFFNLRKEKCVYL